MDKYVKKTSAKKKESQDREPWDIHVSQGCKMRNVIPYCLKTLKSNGKIMLTGVGAQMNKTISLAEIVKRKHSNISQKTDIYYTEFEDQWDPKDEDKGLDSLCVTRNVPTIKIEFSINAKEGNDTEADVMAVDDGQLSKEAVNDLKRDLKATLKEFAKEKPVEEDARPNNKKQRSRSTPNKTSQHRKNSGE
eukprot:Seg6966.1 transcript_id=Seg6966.1/GoldUCD/mRNA.D3Y31 product="Ribonuclease P protein subunit p25-like protein" protein_id=Seg6966.1/GoldUCD/D3Y31